MAGKERETVSNELEELLGGETSNNLMSGLRAVKKSRDGFGRITLEIRNGDVDVVRVEISQKQAAKAWRWSD